LLEVVPEKGMRKVKAKHLVKLLDIVFIWWCYNDLVLGLVRIPNVFNACDKDGNDAPDCHAIEVVPAKIVQCPLLWCIMAKYGDQNVLVQYIS